jgi:recombination protein RecA
MSEGATGVDSARTRRERLDAVIATARRRFGPHVIRLGADLAALAPAAATPLPCGALGLDLVVGGLPPGKITEYVGRPGCGVEGLALTTLAACQRAGGLSVLVDAEASLDLEALSGFSIDVEKLVLVCPTTAVEAWAILTRLARSGAPDLLLVASLPSLVALPFRGWGQRADTALTIRRRLARLACALQGRPTAALLVNQPLPSYDDRLPPEDRLETVGGAGVSQHAAVRVALHGPQLCLEACGVIGHLHVWATILKHHGLPRSPALPLAITPRGLRWAHELVELGLLAGCLDDTPLGLTFGEHLLGRSVTGAAQTLERDTALAHALHTHLRAAWPGRARGHYADGHPVTSDGCS